ncbi:SIS domain-containing protein [Kiloniella laminariae]|uniref:SIS domain-containing protein n=1 Tax=Kiloniella laminariae TaxID=454162 RepID=A0ABT4LLY7_9PROT|nr:SIS domain-containing protein [Kiloniella laminariae]MCZ4282107.1 SIS domain-containing protein [Kiloniella laminariae]
MTRSTQTQSLMSKETEETAAVVSRQLKANRNIIEELSLELRSRNIRFIATCARGSSDHACAFAKYLLGINLGLPVVSYAPSIATLYGQSLKMKDCLFLAISQSGRSPDLVQATQNAKDQGAFVVCICNDAASPLVALSDYYLPLHAGPEKSVAATKSYIASLTALLQLSAVWGYDSGLLPALDRLPDQLDRGLRNDWSEPQELFSSADNLFTVGRGPGFGIALEAALKFKETAYIHAEAFSAAEVKHGPMSLVADGYPVLIFRQRDQSWDSVGQLSTNFREMGGAVFTVQEGEGGKGILPIETNIHPFCQLPVMIQSFYIMAEKITALRGLNPDSPRNLKKVTETV